MRRDTPVLLNHGGRVTLVLTLLALPLFSCADSQSVACSSGVFCPAGWRCSGDGESCIVDTCGDSITQDNEACDDGNTTSNDGCNSDCSSNERCGNGIKDPSEVCDDGNTLSGDGCSRDCLSDETCGNKYLDVSRGEVCDDGNNIAGDRCSHNCKSDETCGNGFMDPGETCDDGNNANDEICSADCKIAGTGCGNGQRDAGEECDDGDRDDEDDCLSTCQFARCGDGIVSHVPSRPEQCDDGKETASCNLDCTKTKCGDGIVNGTAGEQCDNGSPDTDTPHCTKACRVSFCGDGYYNDTNEKCDDGNGDYCGTCSSTCQAERAAKHAKGSIEAVEANKLKDGDSFTLYDGQYGVVPVTFEFKDRPNSDTHIKRNGNAQTMAKAIEQAINEYRKLQIQASIDKGQQNRVFLTHKHKTSYGNQEIIARVKDNSFKVDGMKGGVAGDCLEGVGCKSDDDCAPGLGCKDTTCQKKP